MTAAPRQGGATPAAVSTRTTMSAVVQRRYGEADALAPATLPVPEPAARQVLIRVEAAALNPADVFMMRGQPRIVRLSGGLTRPTVPVRGTDVAGEVVAVGSEVTHWRRGDRVFGEAASGSLAQFATAAADRIARIPESVTARDAAASVMAGLAARDGLVAGGLLPQDPEQPADVRDQRVLVIGASGGIGSFAVQMAAAAGATVTGVCSTRNVETVRALGATAVVDYTREEVTDLPAWFDLVFDNVGAVPMERLHELTAVTGVVVPNSGLDGPDGGAFMRVAKTHARRLLLRRRYRGFYSAPSTAKLEHLARELAQGTITPLIDIELPLAQGSEAMARVASGHARGKVVVLP